MNKANALAKGFAFLFIVTQQQDSLGSKLSSKKAAVPQRRIPGGLNLQIHVATFKRVDDPGSQAPVDDWVLWTASYLITLAK